MEQIATATQPSMRSDNAAGMQLSFGTDMTNSVTAPATSVSANGAHLWHSESNGVKTRSSAQGGPVTVPPPKSTAAQRAAVAEGLCPATGVDESAPGPMSASSGVLAPAHPKRIHQTIRPPNRNASNIASQKAAQPPPHSVPPPPPGPLPPGFHPGMIASMVQVPAGVPPPPPPFPPPQLPDMQANAFAALQRQMGMVGFPHPPGLNDLQAVTMASMGGHMLAGGLPPDVLGMASLMGLPPNVVPQHFPLSGMLHPGLIPGGICAGASTQGNVDPSSILGKPPLQGLVAGSDGLLHPVGVNGSASLLGLNSPLHLLGQPGFMPGFNGVMMHHPALLQSMPGSVVAHASVQQQASVVAGGFQTEIAEKEVAGTTEGNEEEEEEEEEEGEPDGDSDEDDEPLMSCIRRWAWKDDALSGTTETCSSGGARNAHRRRLASIRWAINSLLEEVADQAAFEMAKEVFIKARPDAAKSWDSLAARLAMAPSQAELEALHSKDGVGPAKIVELSQVPGGQSCEGDDDMEVDDMEVSSAAAVQTPGLVDANPVGQSAGTMGDALQGDQQKLRDAIKQKETHQNAKSPDTTFPASKAQLSKEPAPAEFEEIVNSLPVQPYWKIPSQSAEVPVGVRLRVFDFDGAKEVASMAVTKPLVFGGDTERAHVVERRGLGVYAEHVGLVYTPKGFHVYPISGQSVVSAVVHHRALLIKLRSETAKLPADRAEHCNGLLDQMEKQPVSSTLFQPGDGRRKLTWQACCFSLGRSERIYFLDLVTRADLLHASVSTQQTSRATEAVEATADGNPENSNDTLASADGKGDVVSPQQPLARSRSKSARPEAKPAETKQPSNPEDTVAQAESKSDAKTAHAKAPSRSPKRTSAHSPARASRQDRRNLSRKRSSSRNRRDQDRGRAKSNSRRRDRDRERRRSKSRRRSRSRGRRSPNNRRSRSRRRHRSRSASRVYRRKHRSLDRRKSVSRDRHHKSRSTSRGKEKDKTKDRDKDKKKRPKKAKKEKAASPKILRKQTPSPLMSSSPSSSDLVAPLKKQVAKEVKEDVKRARNVLDGDRDMKVKQLAGHTKQADSDAHVPEHESVDKDTLDQVADTNVANDEAVRKHKEEQEQKLREQKLRDEILRKARERREREEKEKRELEEKEKEQEASEKQEQDEKRRKEQAAITPVEKKSVGQSSSDDSSIEAKKKKNSKAKGKKNKDKKAKGRDPKRKRDAEKRRKRKKRRETSSSSERSSNSS